jgi:hypothetical protein
MSRAASIWESRSFSLFAAVSLPLGGRAATPPALPRGTYAKTLQTERDLVECPGPESNQRHRVLQTRALPTELPGREESGYQRLFF